MRRSTLGVLLTVLLVGSGCASTDSFNRSAAQLTHDAIVQSEQNQCTVHPAPCLTDPQFKAVNRELNKISVAGQQYTKLRIAGKDSVKDVSTFLSVVAAEVGILSKTYPDGVIGKVLQKLTELQQKAVKLLG